MLSNVYKKIMSLAEFQDIDKILENIDDIIVEYNPTQYDSEKNIHVKSETSTLKNGNSVLQGLYVSQNHNNLVKFFEEIEKPSLIPIGDGLGLLETEQEYKQRLADSVSIKKIFLKVFKKANFFKGTKDFIEFVLFFYNKLKYFPNDDQKNPVRVLEISAFKYSASSVALEQEFEEIIKPIVHPVGWESYYTNINKKNKKGFFQNKSTRVSPKLDTLTIGSSSLFNFNQHINIYNFGNIGMNDLKEPYSVPVSSGSMTGKVSRKVLKFNSDNSTLIWQTIKCPVTTIFETTTEGVFLIGFIGDTSNAKYTISTDGTEPAKPTMSSPAVSSIPNINKGDIVKIKNFKTIGSVNYESDTVRIQL